MVKNKDLVDLENKDVVSLTNNQTVDLSQLDEAAKELHKLIVKQKAELAKGMEQSIDVDH